MRLWSRPFWEALLATDTISVEHSGSLHLCSTFPLSVPTRICLHWMTPYQVYIGGGYLERELFFVFVNFVTDNETKIFSSWWCPTSLLFNRWKLVLWRTRFVSLFVVRRNPSHSELDLIYEVNLIYCLFTTSLPLVGANTREGYIWAKTVWLNEWKDWKNSRMHRSPAL